MQENLPPTIPVDQRIPNQWRHLGVIALCFLLLILLIGSTYLLNKTKSSVSNSGSSTTADTMTPSTTAEASIPSTTPNEILRLETNKQTNSTEESFPKLGSGRTMVLQVGHHYGGTSEICSVQVHTALTIDAIHAGKVTFTLNNKSGSLGVNESIYLDLAKLEVISMTDDAVVFRSIPVLIEC